MDVVFYSEKPEEFIAQALKPSDVIRVEKMCIRDSSKRNADIIVPNGGENTTAIEMLAHHIRSLIEKANML